jgi:hypothetical protein
VNLPDSDHGEELAYIMGVEQSVNAYAARITSVFSNGSNALANYPATNLGNQLKTIARMISGGCKTKIYLCQLGGFDTHNDQVDNTNTIAGDHADLLTNLASSLKYFLDDLQALGMADRVAACTFSEFGRCARENGSYGTDHGTLAPMYLFGKNIQAGVMGTNVNLSNLTQDGQVQGLQFDYRQVFATLLQDWLGASPFILEQAMFDGFLKIPVVDAAAVVDPDCYWGTVSADQEVYARPSALQVFPNPASVTAEVSFVGSGNFDARLSLHSLGGGLISSQFVRITEGNNLFWLEVVSLPPGTYFVRLEQLTTGQAQVRKLIVAR